MNVPYIDLKRQYASIKKEIDQALQDTIESCAFVAGKKVKEFEGHFAEYCGCKRAIGVSSGTSALYTALKSLAIGKGDIVVTVPFTFIATVESITLTGAKPVFVDIDIDTYNMSGTALQNYVETNCVWNEEQRKLIDKASGLRVKAIMPVHLYGQIADMEEITAIAESYALSIVEDAAQAHGATYKNRKAGSFGHLACFSFYPTKNLGAYGQGGMITTSHDELADRVAQFINHGQDDKYLYSFEGWNFKMDGFQAAVLDVKLQHLDAWNQTRRHYAGLYAEKLNGHDMIVLPEEKADRTHVYHLYVVRVPERPRFERYLKDNAIGYTIAYPLPLHVQPAYQGLGYNRGDFPHAELAADSVVGLPIFPELTTDEIHYVCERIRAWPGGK